MQSWRVPMLYMCVCVQYGWGEVVNYVQYFSWLGPTPIYKEYLQV